MNFAKWCKEDAVMRDESTQSLYEFNKDLSTVSDESLRLELEQSYRIINALSSSYHEV